MKAVKVEGFDGRYTLYEDGRIFKKIGNDKRCKGHFINHKISHHGYAIVDIQFNKKRKVFMLHKLLAIYFIPNPNNKPCINHKDGKKLNNSLLNLEWCTYKENNWHSRHVLTNNHNTQNQREAARISMRKIGKNQGIKNRLITMEDADKIRILFEQKKNTRKELALMFRINKTSISRIIRKESYVRKSKCTFY